MGFRNLEIDTTKNKVYEAPTDKEELKEMLTDETLSKKDTIPEDKELEEIVEQAIKEIEKGESVTDEKECCHKVRDTMNDLKEKLQKNYEINKEVEHKFSNLNKILLIMFLAGVAFGMSEEKWLPYASMIWEFGKDIITKG